MPGNRIRRTEPRDRLHLPAFSIGVDTIKLGFTIPESDIDFRGWIERTPYQPDGSAQSTGAYYLWTKFETLNGTVINLKYVPVSYRQKRINLLLIEFSWPKLVFGNNYRNIEDYQIAIDVANDTLAWISCLPALPDIRTATLYRLDLNALFHLGRSAVPDYLQAISQCHHPHREPVWHKGETVYFPYEDGSTSFYDKYKESGAPEAEGLLKFEIQARSKVEVGRLVGLPSATLPDFSPQILAQCLLKELATLHLDVPIVSDRLEIEKLLLATYKSKSRVQNMFGYWTFKQSMTREQMLANEWTPGQLAYYNRLLTKAGLSGSSGAGTQTLRPLSEYFPELSKFSTKPLSVTRGWQAVDG